VRLLCPSRAGIVTIQDSSLHVLDKSALYSGSLMLVGVRAVPPQAAQPALLHDICELP